MSGHWWIGWYECSRGAGLWLWLTLPTQRIEKALPHPTATQIQFTYWKLHFHGHRGCKMMTPFHPLFVTSIEDGLSWNLRPPYKKAGKCWREKKCFRSTSNLQKCDWVGSKWKPSVRFVPRGKQGKWECATVGMSASTDELCSFLASELRHWVCLLFNPVMSFFILNSPNIIGKPLCTFLSRTVCRRRKEILSLWLKTTLKSESDLVSSYGMLVPCSKITHCEQ